MNLKHTFIAALLLISTASHAAAPAQRVSIPKKVVLSAVYAGGFVATGIAALGSIELALANNPGTRRGVLQTSLAHRSLWAMVAYANCYLAYYCAQKANATLNS